MSNEKNYKKFWENDNFNNIVPIKNNNCPEGFDVIKQIKHLLSNISYSSVIDYGCGTGRLTTCFPPETYLGVDINKNAIKESKHTHKDYKFEVSNLQKEYETDLTLFYTVLLHIDDNGIKNILNTIKTKYILICEILGNEWRAGSSVPAYNRELEEYDLILQNFKRIEHLKIPYAYYSKNPKHKGKNTNISFLLYEEK
jgi:trans-aconitate methyltransferase